MNTINIKNVKKALLVGAGGKTGYSYSRLLLHDAVEVYAYDQNPAIDYSEELIHNPLFHRVGSEEYSSGSILDRVDSVTLSPGVSLKQDIFLRATRQNKLIFSELEYCFEGLSDRSWICVTGTDGKSTTVAMIEHVLNHCGRSAISCGNYGLSFSKLLLENEHYSKYQYLVAELSSYQLELCRNLKSDVSLYLNLAPDHLNRYESLEEYGRVKWNIAASLKANGLLIINKNLMPEHSSLWKNSHPISKIREQRSIGDLSIIKINTVNLESDHFIVNEKSIVDKNLNLDIVNLSELQVQGLHNYSNILFCLETLRHFHCRDIDILSRALKSFRSLPHRFEKILTHNGNVYINDSKATTTQAAEIAINNAGLPLYLFIGGRSKGEDYSYLAEVIARKKALVFVYGENRYELKKILDWHKIETVILGETLSDVFQEAHDIQKARNDKNVTFLLSPASTSWDQYTSFEERGEHFRKLVLGQADFETFESVRQPPVSAQESDF